MNNLIEARFLQMKKNWISLILWLLFPMAATISILSIADIVKDDSRIPIGIVIEESNKATNELMEEISSTSFIKINELSKDVALYQLNRHKLDSVFIIHNDFAEQIRKGKRNNIITSYRTNQSLAYSPVKEMILSYVQQETGRSKTAYIIQELAENYDSKLDWSFDEIISKSKDIQQEEDLLQTAFSFGGVDSVKTNNSHLWNIWGIWGIFTMLSTLLLFDWVVKEHHSSVLPRFAFMRISFKGYLVSSLGIYSLLLVLMDIITVYVFHLVYLEQISLVFILGLLCYRLVLLSGSFLLAMFFHHVFRYYVVSFAITLLTLISSGAILPTGDLTSRWPMLTVLNPLEPLLSGEIINFWPAFLLLALIIWYLRKDRYYA